MNTTFLLVSVLGLLLCSACFAEDEARKLNEDGNPPREWLLRYHLNPDDPSIGDKDSDGDRLTNSEEYLAGTDPTVMDTDHDGVDDWQDQYPTDPRRSADIPVQFLAVLDISGTVTGGHDVTHVALDDEGNAAFGFYSGDNGLGEPSEYKVYTWKAGVAHLSQTIQLQGSSFKIKGFGEDFVRLYQPWHLRANGMVYGGTYAISQPGGSNIYLTGPAFAAIGNNTADLNVPYPYEFSQHWGEGMQIAHTSDKGICGYFFYDLIHGKPPFVPPVPFSEAETFQTAGFVKCNGIYTVFDPIAPPYIHDTTEVRIVRQSFIPSATNSHGWAAGVDPAVENIVKLWDGTTLRDLGPGRVLDMNEEGDVLGTGDKGGWFWQNDGSNGKRLQMNEMVPRLYRQQIQKIENKVFSNRDHNTDGHPLWFIFSAEDLEGDGTGKWVEREFRLHYSPLAKADETAQAELFVMEYPPGVKIISY